MTYPGHSAYSPPAASKVASGPPPGGSPGISETTIMPDQNTTPAASNQSDKVVADAVLQTKKSRQLPPLSSIPLPVKSGVEWFQQEAGLKNVGEAVAVLIAALLGETIKQDNWDGSPETAEAIGAALFESPAVKAVLAKYEAERDDRATAAAKSAQIAKLLEMGITLADVEKALGK